MSSSRLIKRLAALALLAALPVTAYAQTSRVEGMNVPGDFIKDYTGMYTYLSGITSVGNLVYGELGVHTTNGPLDRSVGAVLGNLWEGKAGVWGIHLRELSPSLGSGDRTGSGIDPNVNSNEQFDLMWGKKFGTTSLGLRFDRSYMRFESEIPGVAATTDLKFDQNFGGDPNLRRNVTGLGAGVGFEMNQSTTAEVSFQYQNRQFEEQPATAVFTGTKNEEDGPSTYLLAGRMMWQWEPNVMVVPVFKYYSFDLSNKVTGGAGAGAYDNSLKGWSAGIAGNWTVGTNDLFVLGANFAQNRAEQEYDLFGFGSAASGDTLKITESITPQIFAALETHVNNWLTLRFGAQKDAFSNLKVESRTRPFKEQIWESSFSMNLGAGIKVGTMQVDAIVNNDFPHNMPYLVSGSPTNPLFTKVTATYPF